MKKLKAMEPIILIPHMADAKWTWPTDRNKLWQTKKSVYYNLAVSGQQI